MADDVDDGSGGKLRVEPRTDRTSGRFFFGGTILTIADVETRNSPRDSTLLANMRGNGYERVFQSNSRFTLPVEDGDVVIDDGGRQVA